MTESELQQYLAKLEAELKRIPNWLYVVWLTAEIRKVKDKLSEFKLLEYKGD